MTLAQKAQAVVDAVQSAPPSESLPVMIGSFLLSFLQPLAVCITVIVGVLTAHGIIEKKWGRDFLWLNRLFRKGK
jgi:type IV secretory pathway VirB2 component (pilin)